MATTIQQRVCLHCHTDVVAIDYHSPMWQWDILIPAAIRVSCECGETFEYIETVWRGERLYTYPPKDMSDEAVMIAIAAMNAAMMRQEQNNMNEFDYLNDVVCPDCGSDMFFIFAADENGHVTEFSSFECLDCGKHYGDVVITFADDAAGA